MLNRETAVEVLETALAVMMTTMTTMAAEAVLEMAEKEGRYRLMTSLARKETRQSLISVCRRL